MAARGSETAPGIVEALTTIAVTLTKPTRPGRPNERILREALYLYGFNPRRWDAEIPADHAAALTWMEGASLPVVDLESSALVRKVLDADQVAALLDALHSLGKRADRVRAFFGGLYYVGMRPSDAADLRHADCLLPGRCRALWR